MLRSTSAAFGAGVGGADSVTVLPFDGSDSTLARRNARNIHHLLIEESGVNRLVDPAAGSGFVESLTDRLAKPPGRLSSRWRPMVAWSSPSSRCGGDGDRYGVVGSSARLATRKESVTGVSEFPDDAPGAVIPEPVDGFPVRRPAAPFEALRDAADRARETGESPVVHLAALGSLADHTARSTWITNFLAAGGLDAIGGDVDGAASAPDVVAAFEQAGASVAVLCSSDSVYAELAAPAATALKAAGADFVALAGHPGERRDELALRASTPSSMSVSTCSLRSPTCMNAWGCADGECREARMVVLRARFVGLHRRGDRER